MAAKVPVDAGHRHDWENVVVFYDGSGAIGKVASSCHNKYSDATFEPRLHEGKLFLATPGTHGF